MSDFARPPLADSNAQPLRDSDSAASRQYTADYNWADSRGYIGAARFDFVLAGSVDSAGADSAEAAGFVDSSTVYSASDPRVHFGD